MLEPRAHLALVLPLLLATTGFSTTGFGTGEVPASGFAAPAIGQAGDPRSALETELDEYLRDSFPPDAPGVSVIVELDGEPVLHTGYGLAEMEHSVPNKRETVFRIGSITKQFTGVGILKLVEAGKLDLEDPVKKHLPRFERLDDRIRVRHLLAHTSGLKSYTDMGAFWKEVRKEWDLDDLIALFLEQEPVFEPGAAWAYCNSGYVLLGAVIEAVSGQEYDEFLAEHVWEPAGLDHTSFGDVGSIVPNRAEGYERGGSERFGGWRNDKMMDFSGPHAAGALLSTTGDLARWHRALMNYDVLEPETLDLAWTPFSLDDGKPTTYACGWQIGDVDGRPTVEHGGGIFGFSTYSLCLIDHGVYVAVFANASPPARSPGEVAKELARRVLADG